MYISISIDRYMYIYIYIYIYILHICMYVKALPFPSPPTPEYVCRTLPTVWKGRPSVMAKNASAVFPGRIGNGCASRDGGVQG
jgi:hypothetical protein